MGVGELLARLERLKQVLASEGLFRPERKRPLPFLPGKIGLICGRDSDAEHDVLQNARRRWPAVAFRVENTAVQGSYAVGEVMEALRTLDADPEIDVIIIARGGGAMEDLLPFSDEALVRAVSAARTPVVSAIGHEQDAPILDLVADVRASTPTDAEEGRPGRAGAAPARPAAARPGRRCLAGAVERELAWLKAVRSRPALADPVREIERQSEQVAALRDRARRCLSSALDRAGDELSHTRARLLAPPRRDAGARLRDRPAGGRGGRAGGGGRQGRGAAAGPAGGRAPRRGRDRARGVLGWGRWRTTRRRRRSRRTSRHATS